MSVSEFNLYPGVRHQSVYKINSDICAGRDRLNWVTLGTHNTKFTKFACVWGRDFGVFVLVSEARVPI